MTEYHWNEAGFLERVVAGTKVPVRAKACVPGDASAPLSIRNLADEELELIERLDQLENGSRRAIERDLAESRFTILVQRIRGLETENELRLWEVETNLGRRRFVTGLEDWPTPQGAGYLVRDAWGDFYEIPAYASLDEVSQRKLWPLLA